jgi:hypothetical protein
MVATDTGVGLEVMARPMGVQVAELAQITREVFTAALANGPAPEPVDRRAVLVWMAAQAVLAVQAFDRGEPSRIAITQETAPCALPR